MLYGFLAHKKSSGLKFVGGFALVLIALLLSSKVALAAAIGVTFTDNLNSLDTSRFRASGTWANGSPFVNGWKPDHVLFANGQMQLKFDNTPYTDATHNLAYTSGEYSTPDFYGYGCYEARLKPTNLSGVITAFFSYAGQGDQGPYANGTNNDINVEFLGRYPTKVQLSYTTRGAQQSNTIDLGFDASKAFHNYAYRWTAQGIAFFIDGKQVWQVNNSASTPTPVTTDAYLHIINNLWAVDGSPGSYEWAGQFTYPGRPITVNFDWIKYTQSNTCRPTNKVTP